MLRAPISARRCESITASPAAATWPTITAHSRTPSGSISQADLGYNKSFRGNYFLDFGLQREWTEHITWRVDLYNVLGWFDINLNKRNYINRVDTYRPEAATVGLSAIVAY